MGIFIHLIFCSAAGHHLVVFQPWVQVVLYDTLLRWLVGSCIIADQARVAALPRNTCGKGHCRGVGSFRLARCSTLRSSAQSGHGKLMRSRGCPCELRVVKLHCALRCTDGVDYLMDRAQVYCTFELHCWCCLAVRRLWSGLMPCLHS